ncbi:MAG: hypothetical protein PWQ37_2383 [Candidatus Petromonas sp.]|nr:hypothetical protein [Candidatus Petromonas sp.]
MAKAKSYMKWSWILFVGFMGAGIVDFRFAVVGLLCMISPLALSLLGKGKRHCSHYCPRGSFLARFMSRVSMGYDVPSFMRKKSFKTLILILMLTSFTVSLYTKGLTLYNIGFTLFRLVIITTVIGVFLGVFYKPRTWCTICPMGYASGLIKQSKDKKAKAIKKVA